MTLALALGARAPAPPAPRAPRPAIIARAERRHHDESLAGRLLIRRRGTLFVPARDLAASPVFRDAVRARWGVRCDEMVEMVRGITPWSEDELLSRHEASVWLPCVARENLQVDVEADGEGEIVVLSHRSRQATGPRYLTRAAVGRINELLGFPEVPVLELVVTAPSSSLLYERLVVLERAVVTLGREPDCDIVTEDSSVSRHHARLLRTETGYHLVDLGSANGTLVNGARAEVASLRPGDVIQLGAAAVLRVVARG